MIRPMARPVIPPGLSEQTRDQLNQLPIHPERPMVICDVDEVVVHFTSALEHYLLRRELWLDISGFALNGSIRNRSNGLAVANETVAALIDEFFHDHTHELEPIEGAVAAISQLADQAQVVMLTNLPHHARDKRIHNLKNHGLSFPVVTNSGPKGPAISHLAGSTSGTVVFVDDSPNFIKSAREHAPDVHLVHFLQDERFARHAEHFEFVSLRTGNWQVALPHIQSLISNAPSPD
jgi:FMN phosphatase YigB (HAD superfamily)